MKFRKLALLALSIVMASSTLVACGGGNASSNTSNGSSSGAPSSETPSGECNHVWGEWQLEKAAGCVEEGVKFRTCTLNASHVEKANFAARGHDYGNTGVCVSCAMEATVPQADPNATYLDVTKASSGIIGTGEEYDWYQLVSGGYYEITITSENPVWINFDIDQSGQYMLYSTENNGVSAARYDGSEFFITPVPYDARVLSDGNFISTVDCDELHYNDAWRAYYAFTGEIGAKVKIHIERFAEPVWTPVSIREVVTPTQINGKVAENGPNGAKPAPVPYESEYFYDVNAGYYRLGTPEAPGSIIYVAITSSATRLMDTMNFCSVNYQGNNLSLSCGMTVEGNYLVRDYAAFFMNNGGDISGETPADPNANCYQNYVNKDGMYPVTPELYEFLQLYLAKNKPVDIPDSIWGNDAARAKSAWLAPCYVYAALEAGSEESPYALTLGANSVKVKASTFTYCNFSYADDSSSVTYYNCNISCSDPNAVIIIGDQTIKNGFNVNFETNNASGITFRVASLDKSATSISVTISKLENGTQLQPIELSKGNATLNPIEILKNGEYVYEAHYSYTASASGTLTVTSSSDALILVDGNPLEGEGQKSFTIEVTADQEVSIYVSSTSTSGVNVTLS